MNQDYELKFYENADRCFEYLDEKYPGMWFVPHAKAAIKRLHQFGKTNIRYSLIEEYGEDRVRKDLRKVVPYAKLDILTEDHEPDQIRDWLYDGGVTKMTVMYPFMPLVIISIDD